MNALIEQAYDLHAKLNNAAYTRLCVYARYSSYQPAAERDQYVARLNDILGRSERRINRRILVLRAATTPQHGDGPGERE